MTLIHFGKRTGTDRYLNGPYRFTFSINGLFAVLALIAAVALGVIAHCAVW